MKFSLVASSILLGSVSAIPLIPKDLAPRAGKPNPTLTRDQVARLAPDLGFTKGFNPENTSDCRGPIQPDGNLPHIPCACPPDRNDFIDQLFANAVAGKALKNPTVGISFPLGDSVDDQHSRITASFITLQNLNGPGKGCPGVSTTLPAQAKALDAGVPFVPPPFPQGFDPNALGTSTSTSAAVSTTTPATNVQAPVSNGGLTRDLVDQLAPQLGSQKNNNPNKFGDCDGPVQPDGKIPRVPCACPPDRKDFIDQLFANAVAGKALKNPTVKISFPTGNSVDDQKKRITASFITLQNLNGPGKGCPGVSTTLPAQAKALDAGVPFVPPPSTVTTSVSLATAAPNPNGAKSTTTVTSTTLITLTTTLTRGETIETSPPAAATTTSTTAAAAATTTKAANNNNNGNNAPQVNVNGGLTRDLVERLAPELGSQKNNNPNKFGDCDGPVQPNGKIPKVPCACPPDRGEFIDQLLANALAGKALKNPSVRVNFPLGDSIADKHGRITASIITLQNLNGPGKGCPGVSTTLAAQSNALDGK